jgi:hypothetical protein
MCLIGEPGISGHLTEWTAPSDLLTSEVQAPHEQIAVRAGPIHHAKLTRQVIAREAGHRLKLR